MEISLEEQEETDKAGEGQEVSQCQRKGLEKGSGDQVFVDVKLLPVTTLFALIVVYFACVNLVLMLRVI